MATSPRASCTILPSSSCITSWNSSEMVPRRPGPGMPVSTGTPLQ